MHEIGEIGLLAAPSPPRPRPPINPQQIPPHVAEQPHDSANTSHSGLTAAARFLLRRQAIPRVFLEIIEYEKKASPTLLRRHHQQHSPRLIRQFIVLRQKPLSNRKQNPFGKLRNRCQGETKD